MIARQRKSAFITGGTSGIGAVYSQLLAAKGLDLIIVDRNLDQAKNFFIDSIEKKYNIDVTVLKADLSVSKDVKKLEAYIKRRTTISYLINCAGFGVGKTFENTDDSVIDSMIAVHDTALMHLTKAVIPQMRHNNSGFIVNVSSLAGLIPLSGDVLYGASKASVFYFTKSLSLELKDSGIVFQALAPGFVKTHFHDNLQTSKKQLKKYRSLPWMTPEDVVKASMRGLKKKKVLVIPGKKYKSLYRLYKVLPWGLYKFLVPFYR